MGANCFPKINHVTLFFCINYYQRPTVIQKQCLCEAQFPSDFLSEIFENVSTLLHAYTDPVVIWRDDPVSKSKASLFCSSQSQFI